MQETFGRLQSIIERVVSDYNDLDERFMKTATEAGMTRCVSWVNMVFRDLSRLGYFTTEGLLSLEADVGKYNLIEELEDFSHLIAVHWAEDGESLLTLPSFIGYRRAIGVIASCERPTAYYVQSNQLYLVPTPSTTVADALALRYAYMPTELDWIDEALCDPPTPLAYDDIYYWYVLHRAAKMDSMGSRDAKDRAEYFFGMYQSLLAALFQQNSNPTRVRPY